MARSSLGGCGTPSMGTVPPHALRERNPMRPSSRNGHSTSTSGINDEPSNCVNSAEYDCNVDPEGRMNMVTGRREMQQASWSAPSDNSSAGQNEYFPITHAAQIAPKTAAKIRPQKLPSQGTAHSASQRATPCITTAVRGTRSQEKEANGSSCNDTYGFVFSDRSLPSCASASVTRATKPITTAREQSPTDVVLASHEPYHATPHAAKLQPKVGSAGRPIVIEMTPCPELDSRPTTSIFVNSGPRQTSTSSNRAEQPYSYMQASGKLVSYACISAF